MHIGSVLLAIWLVIGGIAAGQRGDFKGSYRVQQRKYDRGDNSRRPAQLHGREPGYQLHGAAPQQLATTNPVRYRRQQ